MLLPRTLSLLALTGFLLVSCATGSRAPTSAERQLAADVLRGVNAARASGADCDGTIMAPTAPLKLEDRLMSAALLHSEDMAAMGKLTHTGSDGSNPAERIRRAGYEYANWGENAAAGYPTAESVVNGWLRSGGHCRNMLNPNFTEMGLGRVGSYWTQVFARPR